MRNFDVGRQFADIKKSAVEAVKTIFPVEGKTRSLSLDNVWIEDDLESTDYSDQAKTKNKNGTWGIPVYAALTLKDKQTGQVVDRAEKLRLFVLPKVTDRFSYIVNGNEYQVHNQLRLKPGVYTLRQQNGELKTQVNLARGRNFNLMFQESSGAFTIEDIGGGSAKIPLYPILSHLGISHSAMSRAWGEQIANANRTDNSSKAVERATAAFGVRGNEDLKEYLGQTQLSPETTKTTLGKSFGQVDGEMLLAASKKLLDVHMGKKEPEDRDSLEFKELHSLEDFIKERLEKNKKSLSFKILRTIDSPKRVKISQIVNPGAFHGVVENFFVQDDKSSTPEQTNPLEMLSGQYKVTIMGSGGIKSEHAITPEMREVHPSHYGFVDPIHTPESERIGANLHLPLGVVKDGKALKSIVKDKKGKAVALAPNEAFDAKIVLPGQTGNVVKAYYQGKIIEIGKSEADYFTPAPQALFSWSTNLIPFLPSNQGNRAMMAAKMLEQAISLKHREAPLVQVGTPQGASFEQRIGEQASLKSPVDGVVKRIDSDFLTIQTKSGPVRVNLYNNFSLNRKSFLNHEVKVKAGDRVKKGDLLADSNFTRDGTLALGTNLRAAYIPYGGLNFEDGIVITDTAAKKLTSEHIHKKSIDIDDNTVNSLSAFRTQYPNILTPENLKKLDADGVIQKGQKIKMGEAAIAALQKRAISTQIGLVRKQLSDRPKDISVYWTLEDEGDVIDVQKSSKGITVQIKTEESAKIGDKLSGRMGNKGIITRIISDADAPKTADGNPVEIMLNPHGVISRINVGQIYESASGKVAKKTGKPVVVQNFTGEDYLDTTKKRLDASGVDDKEELFDAGGKSLGQVHVGNPYVLKLFKQSTGNFSYRQGGPGHPYDLNQQPLKAGGEESSKSLDLLTMYSMLSHGSRANLREMSWLKANQNDEYWKALKSGQALPPPKAPFVFEKFLGYLKGAGIDVHKNGSKLTLSPLTDDEVIRKSSGTVDQVAFYRAKNMEPIKGGFFDPVKFGGFKGTKWGHLELKEPVLNPVFETAVKKITGLGSKIDDVISGKLYVSKEGVLNVDGEGVTGGYGIQKILEGIDVEGESASLLERSKSASKSSLNDINRKLRYLTALKEFKLKPQDAYMRKYVPIVPPVYRPVYSLPDGNVTSSDVNFLYQNLGILNSMQKLPVMDMLHDEDKADLRKDIYEHVKGVSGLTDINIKGREREGFISEIKGGSGQPKQGFFISKVLSKQQDFVGRGTIIPEPSLGVDEVAIPKRMAWKLFEPFVVRELVRLGNTPTQAMDQIKKETELAKKALEIVMRERKVLLNRAPSLHKFSIMAFKPKITDGTAIKIPPLIVKGFNADFDGDTMTVHVPISDDAVVEAGGMMPSRNLFQPGSGKLMITPSQEAQIGIYYLSKEPAGRKELNALLPEGFKVDQVLNKKATAVLLERMAKELPSQEFAKAVQKLKSAGEKHAYDRGFSLGMNDLVDFKKQVKPVFDKAQSMAGKAKTQEQLNAISNKANEMVDKIISNRLKDTGNPLFDMVESGARGDPSQLRQIMASPLFVQDARGRVVRQPVERSYSEGLDIGDYWTSMYGARKGMMDRAIQTSEPGAFAKSVMASTIDNVITGVDCGTTDGVMMGIDNPDTVDRYTAGDQFGVANASLIDQRTMSNFKRAGAKNIKVRSPLTCLKAKGVCQKCYGLDEDGQLPDIGENIGAKSGQAMSEPLTQMVMNTFHTGGAAGTGQDAGGYQRINQLLEIPKTVPGSATLAPKNGTVTRIEPGIGGGFDVYVGDKKTYVARGRTLKVQVGSEVEAGDPLSDGSIKPQELVEHKGMLPAQEYVVAELKKAYDSQGAKLSRKTFETVVRSLSNTTQVMNNPLNTGHLPGDVVPYTVVRNYNENLKIKKPAMDAVGYALTKGYGPFAKGHIVESKDAKLLNALGHHELEVTREAIKHEPMLKSITTLPLLRRDWMSALGYRNLAKALVEGAGQAWSTDLQDHHPIPAFAYGATFGEGKDGKY